MTIWSEYDTKRTCYDLACELVMFVPGICIVLKKCIVPEMYILNKYEGNQAISPDFYIQVCLPDTAILLQMI